MNNENFVENLSQSLTHSATVKNVYGEPIRVGDKTIIPVATIAYGFGGGYGHGRAKKIRSNDAAQNDGPAGEGAGGGGGMFSKATGVYEITPAGTKFIPANAARYILTGIAIGFLVKTLLISRKK